MRTETRRRELALVVPGETDYLCLIRDFVTAIARKVGFPEERVGEIEIAIDEACANIIEHGYGGGASTRRVVVPCRPGCGAPAIALRVSAYNDRIEVRIRDRGPKFAPEKLRELDVAEFAASDRKRGIGVHIIRSFMDEVRYAYRPGRGNELRLVKYLTPG